MEKIFSLPGAGSAVDVKESGILRGYYPDFFVRFLPDGFLIPQEPRKGKDVAVKNIRHPEASCL